MMSSTVSIGVYTSSSSGSILKFPAAMAPSLFPGYIIYILYIVNELVQGVAHGIICADCVLVASLR